MLWLLFGVISGISVVNGLISLRLIIVLVCRVSVFVLMLIFGFLNVFFVYNGECSEKIWKFFVCGWIFRLSDLLCRLIGLLMLMSVLLVLSVNIFGLSMLLVVVKLIVV